MESSEETSSHLHCGLAIEVWSLVFAMFGIDWVAPMSIAFCQHLGLSRLAWEEEDILEICCRVSFLACGTKEV